MFHQLLLFLSAIKLTTATPVEIQPLNSSGALFENIGDAVIYRSEWTLLTQVRLPQWDETYKFIEYCEKTIQNLCNSLGDRPGESNCKHWANEVKNRILRINDKIEEIDLFTRCKGTRRKRGLINLIGSFSKFLFGTMDHEDSEKIYKRLEDLDKSTDSSINIAEHQLTLLKINTNVLGQSLINLTQQHNILVERSNRLNSLITSMLKNHSIEIKHIHALAEINEVALFMLNELQKLSEDLTSTFFILEALQRNELSPLMLPAKEFSLLFHSIIESHKELNNDFNLEKTIAKVYSDCFDKGLLIKIILPLLENSKFNINKIYTLPIPTSKNSFSILDNVPEYFFNTTHSYKNFELSDSQFQKQCKEYNLTFYVCQLNNPIRIAPDEGSCISRLFRNPYLEPADCKYRLVTRLNNLVVPMVHENSWLFWIHIPTQLYCQCPEGETILHLEGLGIFRLMQNCIFKIGNYKIPFKPQSFHKLNFHVPEESNLPHLDPYTNLFATKIVNMTTKPLKVLSSTNLQKALSANSISIDTLESEINQSKFYKATDTLQIKFNSLTAIIGICVVVLLLYSIFKAWKTKKSPSDQNPTNRNVSFVSRPIVIRHREQVIPRETDDYLETVNEN